ncbi:hypothetical protein [Tsukamurella strandjordii]|uniref:hypothetical protein n=1 Tax=Tsukamurella strandjordii TaxID=147577 RepID=UPI0031E23799
MAHQFRQVDTARMTGAQGYQLVEALKSAADGAPVAVRPENVHELPLRPGPDSSWRRANLALDAAADRAERAADEMDRRLDEAGVPPGSSDLLTLDELLAVAGESSADRVAGASPGDEVDQLGAFRETIAFAEKRGMLDEPDSDLGLSHLRGMLATVEAEPAAFSPAKLGRWLGWVQAAVVAAGVGTLDDMKAISNRHKR